MPKQRQPVVLVVLVGAALDREPVLLVLYVAPKEVAERTEWIDRETGERVDATVPAPVLEAQADRAHRGPHARTMP